MSARKGEKNEWATCRACYASFPKSVIVKHQQICSELSIDSLDISQQCFSSGYVKDFTLHGPARSVEQLPDIGTIPTFKSDLILLHPSTLKCCNLAVGCSVTICQGGKITCGTAWSSSAASLDSIYLNKRHFQTLLLEQEEVICLSKNTCFSVIASVIVLIGLDSKSNNNFTNVCESLLNTIDDTIVMTEDILCCSYYGEQLSFKVIDVISDPKTKINEEMELMQDFSQLSFVENSSSTPIKGRLLNIDDFHYRVMSTITTLELKKETKSEDGGGKFEKQFPLSQIGGLEKQIKTLEDLIKSPFENSDLYETCGVNLPHGVIIHGPSGTGKSMLAHAFASSLHDVSVHKISGPDIISKFYGESEQKLKQLFLTMQNQVPSILIINEFDILCPSHTTNETETRLTSCLCTIMDEIPANKLFTVIAVTNNLEGVNVSLRRPGRFDQEVEIGVPNSDERLDILNRLLVSVKHDLGEEHLREISSITHGYVGADLQALCKEATMISMKGVLKQTGVEFKLKIASIKAAFTKISPSAMKEVTVDIPKVFWTDVGGQDMVKQKLKEAVEWPLKHPEVFKRMGISPPRGLLLYGPPGCSKTLMAKALATESGLNFISIKGPELFNKYLGESERAVRDVFRKARLAAPSIIFFDEIDALSVQRSSDNTSSVGDRVLAQILTELDGVETLDGVIIVAATNRPDIIDAALMRPGRIDRLIHVPLPDTQTRREIFEIQFRSIPVAESVCIDELIKISDGYSGAEICSLCREAVMLALRQNFSCDKIEQQHFVDMFNQVMPATTQKMIDFYNGYAFKTTGTF